jgi:ElaB/YqjD/DUF883 family membrane-anchored ribosome-binding protein
MENEELIRQTMEDRRESITEDLHALEERVGDTVHKVSAAVSNTAAHLKEAVDIKGHVDHHPWLMFGGAVAAGVVVGQMLHVREVAGRRERLQVPTASVQPQAPSMFTKELTKVKGLAIGMALGFVRQALNAELPPALARETGDIIDAMTEKLGGKRLSASEMPSGGR